MTAHEGRLPGKVAVVTGGGSGFGADIAKKLVEDGATVTLFDVDDAGGRAAREPRGRRRLAAERGCRRASRARRARNRRRRCDGERCGADGARHANF